MLGGVLSLRTRHSRWTADYSWSEDKVRQDALSERAPFGGQIRRIGFKLDEDETKVTGEGVPLDLGCASNDS
jgi:hypothetical protein